MYTLSETRSTTFPQSGRSHTVALVVMGIFFVWILWSEAPRLHKQGLSRAWEGNQKGYARLNAIRETGKLSERTAYIDRGEGGPNAVTLYIKDNAWYFSDYPDSSPAELVDFIHRDQIKHMILSGSDERLPAVRDILEAQGNVAGTTIFRSPIWSDTSWEIVPVYHLIWKSPT